MATFYDRFVECAGRWPQNVALEIQRRNGLESYTYAETRRLAECVGRWLAESGYQPGSRLAILADNHPRWVVAFLGSIAAGCTAVPLDTAFRAEQVCKLVKDSGSSLIFCDRKHLGVAEAAGMKVVLLDGTGEDARPPVVCNLERMFDAGPGDFRPIPVSADALASLLYTSGTTADPKGVMLTHGNLMGEVNAVFGRLYVGPDDAVLGVLPLFHALAQMANLLLPLVTGARVVYLESVNTSELLRALRERGISVFAVVPQFFYLIHERIFKEVAQRGAIAQQVFRVLMGTTRLSRRIGLNPGKIFFPPIHEMFGGRMRYLVTGGSRFDPQIGRDFHALGIDVLQAYGLTETTGGAFVTLANDNVIGSVGPPLPGVEVKIVNPQPQETGGPAVAEVAIRGAIVMKGYWNRPDVTAAVLRDGWLYTGDLGYLDAEGNLFLTGRQKEIIVLSNGKNVYPEEIEAHYLKSPYIKEICILGLEAAQGDRSRDRLHGVVVPNFGLLKERRIVNTREVIRFDIEGLSAQLPSTKRILSYEIWQEDLPRTTTRKLKRFEIEKRVRERKGGSGEAEGPAERPLSSDDLAWLEQADVRRALAIVREAASTKDIHPSANLELDLELDSMQRVELLVALEQALGGDVHESRVSEIYTVRELVDAVRGSAAWGKHSGPSRAPFAGWRAVLAEEPVDPEVLAVAEPRVLVDRLLYLLTRLAQMISLDRFDLQVEGLEKLPADGPYLICSNHQSFLDAPILISLLPWNKFRKLFAVGTSELFSSGVMRWMARVMRVVVVDPDANLIPAMRAGAYGLKRGRILILYPEGERSIDGPPKTFKKGAAILSIHLQAPVVPVAIEGFYEAWPRGKRFQKFARLRVRIGDPIQPPRESSASEAAYTALTTELRERVVSMWQELRGEQQKRVAAGEL